MFYGPGAGAGPTASAVVADILNIAGIQHVSGNQRQAPLDPLLAANSWRSCCLVDSNLTSHRNYVRLQTSDQPGVIGKIGTYFGEAGVSIQSIMQFEQGGGALAAGQRGVGPADAEIVVITHEVSEARFRKALTAIAAMEEVAAVAACLRTL
jgi:homoserine dehydrogenase